MKKRRPLIQDQRGLTLIETIVALLISLGVLAMVAALSLSAVKAFLGGSSLDQAQQLGDSAYDFIEARLDDALGICLIRAGEGGQEDFPQAIYVDDGLLYYQKDAAGAVFAPIDAELYQGCSIMYTASISNDMFYLHLEVLDKNDKPVFVRDSSFRLLNVGMSAGRGAYDLSGGEANPRICFIQNQ
ncbi:MAG: type II secretion system protein [Clostridia bacterium]|nr:type II secretion system protein [Clostridia bacterium]